MPFLIKNVRQIPGLSGSAPSRFQNLSSGDGNKALAGQPLYGTGSRDQVGGTNVGSGGNQCGQAVETGVPASDGGTGSDMPIGTYTSCFSSTGPNFAGTGNQASPPPPCGGHRCCGGGGLFGGGMAAAASGAIGGGGSDRVN